MRAELNHRVLDRKLLGEKLSKYQEIAFAIKDRIEAGELLGRLPTTAAMAKEYGVTLVTMHKAFRLLKEDGLIHGAPGRGMSVTRLGRPRSHVIGALLAGRGPLTSDAAAGMQIAAQQCGEGITVVHFEGQDDIVGHLEHMVSKQKVDGVIVMSGAVGDYMPAIEYLNAVNVPSVIVSLSKLSSDLGTSTVSSDDDNSGALVMEHLLQQDFQRIVFIYSVQSDEDVLHNGSYIARRYQQYCRYMLGAGLELLEPVGVDLRQPLEAQIQVLAPVLKEVDAIFCDADRVVLSVLAGALRFGVSIPRDCAVVGIDNSAAIQALGVTSVEQNFREVGAAAVEIILEEIDGRRDAPVSQKIPSELFVRESSAR
jgi:DNA-binding LacI/PurR family transcriptional regulator